MNKIENIDVLITNYVNGEAKPEEAMLLQEWREQSEENNTYFLSYEKTLRLIDGSSEVHIDQDKAWDMIQSKRSAKVVSLPLWTKVAASFAVVMVSAYLLLKPSDTNQYYAKNSEVKATLKDGSDVQLAEGSMLNIDNKFNQKNRTVSLIGKAKFKVEHNDKKPFIVDLDGVLVEDLGTTFTIEAYPDRDTVYVVVEEGIVRLFDENGSEIIIKAGEKAWYIKSQKLIITDLKTKTYKFNFKDTKLVDIVSILDDAFGNEIQLSPRSIGRCKLTTQFFDEDLGTIVGILAETLNFTYEEVNGSFTLKGTPCTN